MGCKNFSVKFLPWKRGPGWGEWMERMKSAWVEVAIWTLERQGRGPRQWVRRELGYIGWRNGLVWVRLVGQAESVVVLLMYLGGPFGVAGEGREEHWNANGESGWPSLQSPMRWAVYVRILESLKGPANEGRKLLRCQQTLVKYSMMPARHGTWMSAVDRLRYWGDLRCCR